ncbi:MAG: glycoside hydrolase family 127 protein, partial [Chloroflexota bacterium]|nr:glycoside hydrolase family 127 protein [Chloroflexota bacterium]
MASSRSLVGRRFEPLPLGSIRPEGWLGAQLRIQAEGLSGHLDELWPDVADSGWIGGQSEGWERGPYWLDGVVPLAYLLDDARLQAKVERWCDYILTHQQEDGWLGPLRSASRQGYPHDPWPVYVALKALTQYHEATGDERVPVAIARFLRRLDTLLDEQPLRSWGRMRWADLVLTIHWLWERSREDWLLELAAKVRAQGFDWRYHFDHFAQRERCLPEECDLTTHIVNNAMAIKAPGVWYRQSGDPADRDAALQTIDLLDRYHGQATGVFTGDEHLAGRSPSQGTELCAVVEYMYSLETLLPVLGEPKLADRLERIAYNALPATLTPEMWAHQYDQQANQVVCKVAPERVYTSNGPDSNLFGLEPNFGCCTANLHQGWPKLASHLWMRTPDGGLAAVAYAPSTVRTEVGGRQVEVTLETDYPFGDSLTFRVRADQRVRFQLYLRVPAWAEGPQLVMPDGSRSSPTPGEFHVLDREWERGDVITLRLPAGARLESRHRGAVAISRGPLVYALRLEEEWRQVGGELPAADWEVYPRSSWNYALLVDGANPEADLRFQPGRVGERPFSPDGAPVRVTVKGRQVPEWALERNAAGPVPE